MIDLEFCSLIEGVEDVIPIIPASQYKHEWMRTAAISMKKDGELGHVDGKDQLEFQHTSRCPGILNIKNEGYIVRTHQDIEIEIDVKKNDIKWLTPFDDGEVSFGLAEPTITQHQPFALAKFMKNWPDHAMETLVKINTPWMVKVPKGYKILQTHPFYLDEDKWHALSGVYDDGIGIPKITCVLQWFKSGKFRIPAGTPVAQLLVYKDDEFNLIQTNLQQNKKWVHYHRTYMLLLKHQFKKSYKEFREKWRSFINNE